MPSKNDLSALKKTTRKPLVLPSNDGEPVAQVEGKPAPAMRKRAGGRPAKSKAEKRTYKVVLSLTEAEGKALSDKAGLAGDATYLYAMLKEIGII